jgi:hypothetical protein
MPHRTASQRHRVQEYGGLAAGRRAKRAMSVPVAPVHALDETEEVTLCGLDARTMVKFDQHFETTNTGMLCADCRAAAPAEG